MFFYSKKYSFKFPVLSIFSIYYYLFWSHISKIWLKEANLVTLISLRTPGKQIFAHFFCLVATGVTKKPIFHAFCVPPIYSCSVLTLGEKLVLYIVIAQLVLKAKLFTLSSVTLKFKNGCFWLEKRSFMALF